MTDRLYDLKRKPGESFWEFMTSVKEALEASGLEKLEQIEHPETPCSREVGIVQIDILYESQGEGGLLLSSYLDGKKFVRAGEQKELDGTVLYIGATGSLIHRTKIALNNRR